MHCWKKENNDDLILADYHIMNINDRRLVLLPNVAAIRAPAEPPWVDMTRLWAIISWYLLALFFDISPTFCI